VIIEPGLCKDQSRQINDLPAGRGFGEGQEAWLLNGVEVALTHRSPLAWRILVGWPMACVRVEIAPEHVPALRITDGRTAEEWTTAILDDQTDSGKYVRELADAAEEVTGSLTCTAQTADGSVARTRPYLFVSAIGHYLRIYH